MVSLVVPLAVSLAVSPAVSPVVPPAASLARVVSILAFTPPSSLHASTRENPNLFAKLV